MAWPKPSLSLILSAIFTAWLIHSTYTIYTVYNLSSCNGGAEKCLLPSWNDKSAFHIFVCTSTSKKPFYSPMTLIYSNNDFKTDSPIKLDLTYKVPKTTARNGTLFLHIILTPMRSKIFNEDLMSSPKTVHSVTPLTKQAVRVDSAYSLLHSSLGTRNGSSKSGPVNSRRKTSLSQKTESHLKPEIIVDVAIPQSLPLNSIPGELVHMFQLDKSNKFQPILFISELRTRVKQLVPMDPNVQDAHLTLQFTPSSLGKIRFMIIAETSLKTMHTLGFSEVDTDDVKGIFFDTNLYLLLLTVIVTAFHLLFDFLAFKSDVQFWRSRDSMAGLSFSSLVFRAVSQIIIAIYLWDQSASLFVLLPAMVGAAIELWKVRKALYLGKGSTGKLEQLTGEADTTFIKWIGLVFLVPLIIGGSVYSLLYSTHRSWKSWAIESAANGVYAFGFLFMLPQLYVNYKLKSVSALPWKAFMYKAFNTFIDDLFAFLLTSIPTSHRVAAFRDDLIFIVYLYQRWLYPVDRSRPSEFGEDDSAGPNAVQNKQVPSDGQPPLANGSTSADFQSKPRECKKVK